MPARTIFITIPLLVYFVRYVLPVLPEHGAVLYLGKGWADAVVPNDWLVSLADHPKITHVFCENPQIRHSRVTPMPIGIDADSLATTGNELLEIADSISLDEKIVDRVVGGWSLRGPVRVEAKLSLIFIKLACTCPE